MAASDEKVIKRGVSLYPKDWEYLDEQARRYGTSASAMIRRLICNEQEANNIRDWKRLNEQSKET